MKQNNIKEEIENIINKYITYQDNEYEKISHTGVKKLLEELTTLIDKVSEEVEQETEVKLLASINSSLAEEGIKDTDGTPLTFSPERIQEWTIQN